MSSLVAVPLQILSFTCEIMFVLENKLRIQRNDFNVPELKCQAIMEDVMEKSFQLMNPDDLFRKRPALTEDELRKFFKVFNHSSLFFEADSFEKVRMG